VAQRSGGLCRAAIAPQVGHLSLCQRTPPWVLPKGDHPIGAPRRRAFARVPALQRASRGVLYAALASRAGGFMSRPDLPPPAEWLARQHIPPWVISPQALLTRANIKHYLCVSPAAPACGARGRLRRPSARREPGPKASRSPAICQAR